MPAPTAGFFYLPIICRRNTYRKNGYRAPVFSPYKIGEKYFISKWTKVNICKKSTLILPVNQTITH